MRANQRDLRMKRQGRSPGTIGLALSTLCLGLIGGVLIGCLLASGPPNTVPPEAAPSFRLMAEAWNTISRHYVDRSAIKPQLMTYGAIGGMVDALGDTGHSHFMTPEMLKEEKNFIRGVLEGIGAEVRMKNRQVVIVAPIDGSPAQRAGLKPGDIILKVNGKEVGQLPLEKVVEMILGPPGTGVALTLMNPDTGRKREVKIIRAHIVLQRVSWARLPGVDAAHIRITGFVKGTAKDFKKILNTIRKEGIAGAVLDLRNNPGGLFDETVSVASQFLAKGNVLLVKDSLGEVTPVPARSGGIALTMPLVVLINEGTSSGAEIVAGALQDGRRAVLVGEKTFGTGTVLESFPLSDGSALMLAVKQWLTPSGNVIWHGGVSPDITVSLAPDAVPLLPAMERDMSALQLQSSEDKQLLRGLDVLLDQIRKEPQS
jgi:carboxyl-terminal processing protease